MNRRLFALDHSYLLTKHNLFFQTKGLGFFQGTAFFIKQSCEPYRPWGGGDVSVERFRLLKVGIRWQIASHFASSVLRRRMSWPARLQRSQKHKILMENRLQRCQKTSVIPLSALDCALKRKTGEIKKTRRNFVQRAN